MSGFHAFRGGARDDGERVPLVGVAGGDPQHPRSMGRDEDRDARLLDRSRVQAGVVELVVPALERGAVLPHQQADDLDRLLEPVDALRCRRQLDAVAAMLVLVPPGPDPQRQAPAADVVDGDRLLEQDRGMAERVARHEHTQADARRPRRDRREQGPRLEAAVVGAAVGVDEVIDQPRVVEAQLLGLEELVQDRGPSPCRPGSGTGRSAAWWDWS